MEALISALIVGLFLLVACSAFLIWRRMRGSEQLPVFYHPEDLRAGLQAAVRLVHDSGQGFIYYAAVLRPACQLGKELIVEVELERGSRHIWPAHGVLILPQDRPKVGAESRGVMYIDRHGTTYARVGKGQRIAASVEDGFPRIWPNWNNLPTGRTSD